MKISRALALAVALVAALSASPASASCAVPPELGEHLATADVVFVGTVTRLADDDRTAVVRVEEIWRGPAMPATVTVFGGPDGMDGFTSVDRTYAAGQRYLFAVGVADGKLQDSACSATREWAPELADQRPAEVSYPTATDAPADAGSVPVGLLAAGAAVLLVVLASALAFRARR